MQFQESSKNNSRHWNSGIILLCAFSILEAIQVLVIASYISSFFPVPLDPNFFIPEKPGDPTRAIFLYRLFVATAVVIFAASAFVTHRQIDSPKLSAGLGKFLIYETVFTALILFSLFKSTVVTGSPFTANLFRMALGTSLIFKILWFWRHAIYRTIFSLVNKRTYLEHLINFSIPLLIFALIYIPDRTGLVARILATDQLHHIDIFVMGPGWAHLKGSVIGYDIFSQYGIGLPAVLAQLSRMIGGFTYENVLLVMLVMIIGYCLLFYEFVRFWLSDIFLAAIAVILFVKLQVFNNDPYLLIYPSRSAVRLLFDLPVLWLLLLHLRRPHKKHLIGAAILVGLAMVYVTDIGIYLYLALGAYILTHLVRKDTRDLICPSARHIPGIVLYLILPLIAGLGALYILGGKNIFSPVFWENTFGYIKDSKYGFGAIYYYQNLHQGNFKAFIISCLIPLIYLFYLLSSLGQFLLNNADRRIIFILVLSVYGLATFHYHVWRAVLVSYYVMSGPFILLVVYGLAEGMKYAKPESTKTIKLGLLLLSLFALFTTPYVKLSPNVFNFAHQSFDLNKKFMARHLKIEPDAALIKRYTKPAEEVCLISSFESLILIKADRKPFFSKFPIIKSSVFRDLDCHGLILNTNRDLQKLLTEIGKKSPEYIFVEKKFIRNMYARPKFLGPSLMLILTYVVKHYKFVEDGQNIVVLKRKS